MNLQSAVRYFARLPFDGYDKAIDTWNSGITRGDFMAFDRFVTARTFGQVKRYIVVPAELRVDPVYELLRSPNGQLWIVEAENADMDPAWADDPATSPVYSYIYQLHVAATPVQVIRYQITRSASGYAGAKTEVVIEDTFCDIERFGLTNSDEYERLVYTESLVTLPGGTDVNKDDQLRVGGRDYMVTEVFHTLRAVQVVANMRGESPTLPDGSPRP